MSMRDDVVPQRAHVHTIILLVTASREVWAFSWLIMTVMAMLSDCYSNTPCSTLRVAPDISRETAGQARMLQESI